MSALWHDLDDEVDNELSLSRRRLLPPRHHRRDGADENQEDDALDRYLLPGERTKRRDTIHSLNEMRRRENPSYRDDE